MNTEVNEKLGLLQGEKKENLVLEEFLVGRLFRDMFIMFFKNKVEKNIEEREII